MRRTALFMSLVFLLLAMGGNGAAAQAEQGWYNVAKSAYVWASSYYYVEGKGYYPPENAADGSLDTDWCNGYAQSSQFLCLDLGRPYPIEQICFLARNGPEEERKNFHIQGAADPEFFQPVNLASYGSQPYAPEQLQTLSVSGSYRYIRFIKTDGISTAFSLREVEIYTRDPFALYQDIAFQKEAFGTDSWEGVSPSLGNDGDARTGWFNQYAAQTYITWMVDLGQNYRDYDIRCVSFSVANPHEAERGAAAFSVELAQEKDFKAPLVLYETNGAEESFGAQEVPLPQGRNQYRYLRIRLKEKAGTLCVKDVKVFAQEYRPSGKNAALGKFVQAQGDPQQVAGITDGALGQGWTVAGQGQATVDFGNNYPIHTVLLQVLGSGTYRVEACRYFDFSSPVLLYEGDLEEIGALLEILPEEPVLCRYLRVVVNTQEEAGLGELEAYTNQVLLEEETLIRTASASQEAASDALDNSLKTVWSSENGWIRFDLGEKRQIRRLELSLKGPAAFEITVQNQDGTERTVGEVVQSAGCITLRLDLNEAYRFLTLKGKLQLAQARCYSEENRLWFTHGETVIDSLGADGVFTLQAVLTNHAEEDMEVFFYQAGFDSGSGRLSSITLFPQNIEKKTGGKAIAIPCTIARGDRSRYYFGVWEKSTLQPLTPQRTFLTDVWDVWKELYVSPEGSDQNSGGALDPLRTPARAQEIIRSLPEQKGDIVVHLAAGYYFLEDPLWFEPQDSGKNGWQVIYQGERGAVLSGGKPVSGFEPTPENPKIWKTTLEDVTCVRQLYVNEKKSTLARSEEKITALSYWDDPATPYASDGLVLPSQTWSHPQDMEFQWTRNWKNITAKVEEILKNPEDPSQCFVRMSQPWWNTCAAADFYDLLPRADIGFVAWGAPELLDEPGEHYYDKETGTLYYMPREGEDMETALVIVPVLEKLLDIEGYDVDQPVKNLQFRGLKLAHTTWYAPDESYIVNGQQHRIAPTSGAGMYASAMVELERAEQISFVGNYFFGSGNAGIYLKNAVSDTVIEANAFSDLGEAAIDIGQVWHGEGTAMARWGAKEPPQEGQINLIDGHRTKVSASYTGKDLGSLLCEDNPMLSYLWLEEEDYLYGETFFADPQAVERGEKTWVRYDFGKPFTIERIRLGFDPDVVTEQQRSGYEILLSNDRNFQQDTVRVALQQESAENMQQYTVNLDKKYRYLMIRTLEATDFALSNAWVFTSDRKPYTRAKRCENNWISNNYITRVLNDGGGIYTLGAQPGTRVERNYFQGMVLANGALYPDAGSAYMLWTDNVVEDVQAVCLAFSDAIHHMTIQNTYSDQSFYIDNTSQNHIQPPITYLPGMPCEKAQDIIRQAGIEPEHAWVKDLVYEKEASWSPFEQNAYDMIHYGYFNYLVISAQQRAQAILDSGLFGEGAGNYPPQQRQPLEQALRDSMAYEYASPEYVEALVRLRSLVNEMAQAMRDSLEGSQ